MDEQVILKMMTVSEGSADVPVETVTVKAIISAVIWICNKKRL